MAEMKWLDAQVQLKRMYNLLGEVESLTRQLAEAVDRSDQVTVELLLGMREDPIRQLDAARTALRAVAQAPETPESSRLRELLRGGPAQTEAETVLSQQVAQNDRLLERVRTLDRVVNQKLTREQSVYQ